MYRADAVGSLTAHVMWTRELQFGGVAGGNQFVAGGSTPDGGVPGAVYFEGSSYQPRYVNPIIISGYLYYTEPRSFSGPSSGPTNCVDLRTGKIIWSRPDVPPLSFGYIYISGTQTNTAHSHQSYSQPTLQEHLTLTQETNYSTLLASQLEQPLQVQAANK